MDHQELSILINEKIEEICKGSNGDIDAECVIGGIALTAAMVMRESGVYEIEMGDMTLTLTKE